MEQSQQKKQPLVWFLPKEWGYFIGFTIGWFLFFKVKGLQQNSSWIGSLLIGWFSSWGWFLILSSQVFQNQRDASAQCKYSSYLECGNRLGSGDEHTQLQRCCHQSPCLNKLGWCPFPVIECNRHHKDYRIPINFQLPRGTSQMYSCKCVYNIDTSLINWDDSGVHSEINLVDLSRCQWPSPTASGSSDE